MLSKLVTVILSNISTLCLITSTLTSLFTHLFDFRKVSFSYILNRHNLLIFPLFECLDPYLYYKVDKDNIDENDIRKAIQIIDNNKNLASGKLIAFPITLTMIFLKLKNLSISIIFALMLTFNMIFPVYAFISLGVPMHIENVEVTDTH